MFVETDNHHDDLLKEAIVIKENRTVRKYDFWPSFYQNSLSSKEVRQLIPSDTKVINSRHVKDIDHFCC